MKQWKALRISVVEGVTSVTPANGKTFTLEELYSLISCEMIEVVPLADGMLMVIDEEGKLRDKPFNAVASQMYDWLKPDHIPGDYIVGDAVICERALMD